MIHCRNPGSRSTALTHRTQQKVNRPALAMNSKKMINDDEMRPPFDHVEQVLLLEPRRELMQLWLV